MRCECDRFRHQVEPCPMPAEEHDGLIMSPALCTGCLFYCWADDDWLGP
jgi:hypothetical protein